jgi:hypothetical protein
MEVARDDHGVRSLTALCAVSQARPPMTSQISNIRQRVHLSSRGSRCRGAPQLEARQTAEHEERLTDGARGSLHEYALASLHPCSAVEPAGTRSSSSRSAWPPLAGSRPAATRTTRSSPKRAIGNAMRRCASATLSKEIRSATRGRRVPAANSPKNMRQTDGGRGVSRTRCKNLKSLHS